MTVHGKHRKRKRGAHKGASSPETKLWENDYLIPTRPEWMPPQTYRALAELRDRL